MRRPGRVQPGAGRRPTLRRPPISSAKSSFRLASPDAFSLYFGRAPQTGQANGGEICERSMGARLWSQPFQELRDRRLELSVLSKHAFAERALNHDVDGSRMQLQVIACSALDACRGKAYDR